MITIFGFCYATDRPTVHAVNGTEIQRSTNSREWRYKLKERAKEKLSV